MNIEKIINDIVWYIPFKKLRNSLREYMILNLNKEQKNEIVPIGHYESPYPPREEILKGYNDYIKNEYNFYGLDMNDEKQLDFYNKIKVYFNDFDFSEHNEDSENYRFYYNNDWYGYGCALYLFSIINHIKPKKIIEIGSGFSTALMLDINDKKFNNKINITSIEPRAERLKSLLRKGDNIKIIETNQQDIAIELFSTLQENDLLFIDSSHVSRPFSDVNRQFFEILPNLNKGVVIHLHDVINPFEYPQVWVLEQRRAYNEAYILRAFLQYNNTFEILCFPSYLKYKYPNIVDTGSGSIFLKKVK